jgi:hypothetical protein
VGCAVKRGLFFYFGKNAERMHRDVCPFGKPTPSFLFAARTPKERTEMFALSVNPHPVFVGDVKDKKKNRYEMVDD